MRLAYRMRALPAGAVGSIETPVGELALFAHRAAQPNRQPVSYHVPGVGEIHRGDVVRCADWEPVAQLLAAAPAIFEVVADDSWVLAG